jgi:hypothetical protein
MASDKEAVEQVLSLRLAILGSVGWLVLFQTAGPAAAQSITQSVSPPVHQTEADTTTTTPARTTASPEVGVSGDSSLEEVVVKTWSACPSP